MWSLYLAQLTFILLILRRASAFIRDLQDRLFDLGLLRWVVVGVDGAPLEFRGGQPKLRMRHVPFCGAFDVVFDGPAAPVFQNCGCDLCCSGKAIKRDRVHTFDGDMDFADAFEKLPFRRWLVLGISVCVRHINQSEIALVSPSKRHGSRKGHAGKKWLGHGHWA